MGRHSVIRAALEALWLLRAPLWLPAPADSSGFVVTLHHVEPEEPARFAPNALLSVTPAFLDRFFSHFTGRGFRFVSVEELIAPANGGGDWRRIAVTLDDGYRDNLECAWPVFRRHRVPFTIFVCPGFSDRTAELWWAALERIIAANDIVSLLGEGPAEILSTGTVAQKHRAFRAWTAWLTTDADETRQRKAIRALAEKYGLDLAALAAELVMDWDEVRRIAAEPLCTIGAHTMTHPALARLPREVAFREMRDSADRIEREIGKRPRTLAFPYGYRAAAGEREAELAGEAELSASFTTRPGYVPASGARHGLPRVSLNGLFQELRYLDALLSPGLWALRDRLRKPR
ncbi:MAG: polysaccharide deacetylase family protein [Propylenella sp.]